MSDQTIANIDTFTGLQATANAAMGYKGDVFGDHNRRIDNAVHIGEVKDEDVPLLKEIMRVAADIELDAIDYGAFANEIRKAIKSGDQIDRIFAEPQFEAAVKEAFEEYKERFKGVKQQGKDKLGLETYSKDVPNS